MTFTRKSTHDTSGRKNTLAGFFVQLLLSLIVLGSAVALASYFLKTSQKAKPHKREPSPPLVQITTLTYQPHQILISGMGLIIAAREITLTPKVRGEIIQTSENFVPGGFFAKGDHLLTIDPIDYKLLVLQRQSDVARAKNDLQLEHGNQCIAQSEFDILDQDVSETEKNLMLRQPQLKIKKSYLEAAQAKLNQAELNLSRTRITAPFSGVILSRSVNLGSRVTESTPLAQLAATDEFWLKLTIPVRQLQWIDIPANRSQQGSTVHIFPQNAGGGKIFRTGQVIRLAANLQKDSRMAILYVAIKDPLCRLPANRSQPKLLLGSYVKAEITGIRLASVVPIQRSYLHDNDTIWLLTKANTLEIRRVKIVARTKNLFIIGSGVTDGEKIIISDLSTPVDGTPIQVITTPPDTADYTGKPSHPKKSVTNEEGK